MITIRTPYQTLVDMADILSELAAAALSQELHEHAAELISASNAHRKAAEVVEARHDEPDADCWIPWAGGECPIPDAKVGEYEVRLATGYTGGSVSPGIWDWFDKGAVRIVAYRLLKKAQEVSC